MKNVSWKEGQPRKIHVKALTCCDVWYLPRIWWSVTPAFLILLGLQIWKWEKLVSRLISDRCFPDQENQSGIRRALGIVSQCLFKWCLVKHWSCKINFMEVLFSFLSSLGVVSILVAKDCWIITTLRVWNFRRVLSNTVLFRGALQSILLYSALKTLHELLKDSSSWAAKATLSEKYCALPPVISVPDLPFLSAPVASVSVSVLSLVSEKPVKGQEYHTVVPFEGLGAGDTASSEWEEVSPAS